MGFAIKREKHLKKVKNKKRKINEIPITRGISKDLTRVLGQRAKIRGKVFLFLSLFVKLGGQEGGWRKKKWIEHIVRQSLFLSLSLSVSNP